MGLSNFPKETRPPDARRLAERAYNFNSNYFSKRSKAHYGYLAPVTMCCNPIGLDLVLRSLDPGRRMRGSDSGLGRARLQLHEAGNTEEVPDLAPAHVYGELLRHSERTNNSTLLDSLLADADPEKR